MNKRGSGTVNEDRLILEQAARWHLWLRERGARPEAVDVFQRWCRSDPRHRQAYRRVSALWAALDALPGERLPWPSPEELAADRYDGREPLPLPGAKAAPPAPRRRRWAAAAAVLIAALGGWGLWRAAAPEPPAVYQTAVAEQRRVALPDGSTVELGPRSRLEWHFDAHRRRLRLLTGEGYFRVAHDPARPFLVDLGVGRVQALGTAFNIRRRRNEVTVTVVEGVVAVEQDASARRARLASGQALAFDGGTLWQARTVPDPAAALAWRAGRLAYVEEPLAAVLEDVARYSSKPVALADESLRGLPFTGTVYADRLDAWLNGLERIYPVRVVEAADQILLFRRG